MKSSIRIFKSQHELALTMAGDIVSRIRASANRERPFSIALSGGSTPEKLYSALGTHYSNQIPWDFVYLFWGDERCVPPDSPDSNYGMAKRLLIDGAGLPAANVFRIRGEDDPSIEAARYSCEITALLRNRDGFPVFDLILLGMGGDGHTASIFPRHSHLLSSNRICAVAEHPETGQRRITLTGKTINNAEAVAFIITGQGKAHLVHSIVRRLPGAGAYPASFIKPVYGSLDWYLDEEAGSLVVDKQAPSGSNGLISTIR